MFRRDSRALDGLFEEDGGAAGERHDPNVQMAGNLYKKATSGRPSWKRRLVVIKDGFLMYYPAARETASDGAVCADAAGTGGVVLTRFDFHPKGLLPLDGTTVERVDDGPTRHLRNSFAISHASFGGRALVLCAESPEARDKWMHQIEACRFITFENAVAGSQQIDKLKKQQGQARVRAANLEADASSRGDELRVALDELEALKAAAGKALLHCRALRQELESRLRDGEPLPDLPFEADAESLAVALSGRRDSASLPRGRRQAGTPAAAFAPAAAGVHASAPVAPPLPTAAPSPPAPVPEAAAAPAGVSPEGASVPGPPAPAASAAGTNAVSSAVDSTSGGSEAAAQPPPPQAPVGTGPPSPPPQAGVPAAGSPDRRSRVHLLTQGKAPA